MARFARVRVLAALSLLVSLGLPVLAQSQPTVAISDFTVNSDNPKFAYLGKGFSEIVAFELGKSGVLRLVDRERRNQALEEMEFALSGIGDAAVQIQVGKLLAVRYLVYGEITDMGGILLVSLKMVDVESTQVVWSDQVMESGGKYAYIGAYFASSLLGHFNARVDRSTATAVAAKAEAKPEAVVALSDGIAALDKGDKEEAKARLREAAKIDPSSSVVKAFLGKLSSASAKFKVVPERYVSYYNPAYLGGLAQDRVYTSYSMGWHSWGYQDENNNQLIARTSDELWGVGEIRKKFSSAGYMYPLTESLGLGAELLETSWSDSVVQDTGLPGLRYAQEGNQYTNYFGGSLTLGLEPGPGYSVGLGVSAARLERRYFSSTTGGEYLPESFWSFGGILAMVARNPQGTFVYDAMASWSTERQYWFDQGIMDFERFAAPIYLEQTLTGVLAGGRLFLALKQVNDLFPDRGNYYVRAMPTVEYWPFEFAALRLGAEGSAVIRPDDTAFGWGATAGLSFKVWKLSLDLNYTLRQRPSRSLAEVVVPESLFFVTVSADGLLKP